MLVRCRFCGNTAPNYDHPECAEKFGESVKTRILEFTIKHPAKKLPQDLQEQINSPQWGWYQDYLARKEERRKTEIHMGKISKDTKKVIEHILARRENLRKLKACNKNYGHHTFDVRIDVAVKVTVEPRY